MFAEVLKPASTNCSVDCSVVSADCHRNESAFLESETTSKLLNCSDWRLRFDYPFNALSSITSRFCGPPTARIQDCGGLMIALK